MGTLYITEFAGIQKGKQDAIQVPRGHQAAQTVTTSGTSARNGTDFDSKTEILRIRSTGNVYYSLGDSAVTASSSDHFLPADTTYDISTDNADRIAVIDA